MSRFMSAVWVVQLCVLLVAALVCLISPQTVLASLEACRLVASECACCPAQAAASGGPSDGSSAPEGSAGACSACVVPRGVLEDPAADCAANPAGEVTAPCPEALCAGWTRPRAEPARPCVIVGATPAAQGLFALVRLFAPFLLAFALFSLHAAMREDERIRRGLSFIFGGIYMLLALLLATDDFTDEGLTRPAFLKNALLAAMITLLLYALLEMIRGADRIFRGLSLLVAAGYAALILLLRIPEPGAPPLGQLAAASFALFAFDTLLGDLVRLRSRLFTVVLLLPVILAVMDSASGAGSSSGMLDDEPPAIKLFLAFCVVCVVVHALYAAWPTEPSARRLSGTANTRPPSLWALWLGQGLALCGAAAFLVGSHRRSTNVLLSVDFHPGYAELFSDLQEIFPSFLLALALFSFSGMQASREWVWKTVSAVFAAFYAVVLLDLLFVWNGDIFAWWTPALAVPLSAMLAVHVRFVRSQAEWFSEDVGEGPDGWVAVDLVLGPMLMLRTLLTRRRASHARGVAASGTLRVLPRGEPGYPSQEFFRPGAEFPLQLRFGNERSDDDAAADARGAAIRLSAMEHSPFDLLLSTGAYSAAENVVDLAVIAGATALGRPGLRWLTRRRGFLEGGIAALRRAPESYATLSYHSQTVRFWVADNNERYLVRYRLVPWDATQRETGLPVSRADFVERARLPGERRPADYLRRELKMRLEGKYETKLRLQAQFHRAEAGDGAHWYNPAADWHADQHLWFDLAELTLDDVLSDEESERLCFNPDNAPFSLGTPISRSLFDHRSIADSERRVMRRVQAVRRWMGASFGQPLSTPKPVD